MTEAEWLKCKDTAPMLSLLRHQKKPRKRRLFAVACCRRIWPLLHDDRSRHAVEIAERFADDLASWLELDDAHVDANRATHKANVELLSVPVSERTAPWKVWKGALAAAHTSDRRGTAAAAYDAHEASFVDLKQSGAEAYAQSQLLRCIFGNPFHKVEISQDWLHWQNATIPKIAAAIYADRAFRNLPILADALEEAGCDDAEILAHCRSGGEHVRGCWVVDLILGKV